MKPQNARQSSRHRHPATDSGPRSVRSDGGSCLRREEESSPGSRCAETEASSPSPRRRDRRGDETTDRRWRPPRDESIGSASRATAQDDRRAGRPGRGAHRIGRSFAAFEACRRTAAARRNYQHSFARSFRCTARCPATPLWQPIYQSPRAGAPAVVHATPRALRDAARRMDAIFAIVQRTRGRMVPASGARRNGSSEILDDHFLSMTKVVPGFWGRRFAARIVSEDLWSNSAATPHRLVQDLGRRLVRSSNRSSNGSSVGPWCARDGDTPGAGRLRSGGRDSAIGPAMGRVTAAQLVAALGPARWCVARHGLRARDDRPPPVEEEGCPATR